MEKVVKQIIPPPAFRLAVRGGINVTLLVVLVVLLFVAQTVYVNAQTSTALYAAVNGTPNGNGTINSPWDLASALNKPSSVVNGKTIYLRGGTYKGRFVSNLTGATVRSYPGEWARIEGHRETSIATAITASSTTLTLADGIPVSPGATFKIENEEVQVYHVVGNTLHLVRGWSGTTPVAHAVGAYVRFTGNTLTVNGSDTVYRDFEVLDSNPNRVYSTPALGMRGGDGILILGPRTKYINLVVHDNTDGLFLNTIATNVEVYGVITYNNGYVDPSRGHGHGLYIQNDTGMKWIKDVISFNNYATGMKGFAETGYANNLHFEGITAFNNSSPAAFSGNPAGYSVNHRFVGIMVGTSDNPPQNITIVNNYLYQPLNAVNELANMGLGYTAPGGRNLVVRDNYIMGGNLGVDFKSFIDGSFTRNTIYAHDALAVARIPSNGAMIWNNNTYHDAAVLSTGNVSYPFGFNNALNRHGGGMLAYDDSGNSTGRGWKQWTGFDANSTLTRGRPTGTQVFIRPNQYEAGRANITIYNWALSPNVAVNLAQTGLTAGQSYEVRDVQNYFGPPVATGTYNPSNPTVSLRTTGLTVAKPVGNPYTPPHTCPEFCVFVVVPTTSAPAGNVRSAFDFDGDGKSDVSVFRPSNGTWYLDRSQAGFTGVAFGQNGDLLAPADYDGDGKTDVAVYRPSAGTFYRMNSSNNTFGATTFGTNGDLPRPGDYDGDGKADVSVYRPSAGTFYRLNSGNGQFVAVPFGQNGDVPLVGDFDGDSKTDVAVYRAGAVSNFYRLNSSNGQFAAVPFGTTGDIPAIGDFDGDNKTDVSVFRPSNGNWYRLNSGNGQFAAAYFGMNGDVPTPGDYDGDGKTDIAVFRAGTWYLLRSTAGFTGIPFGAASDKAIPNAFIQ